MLFRKGLGLGIFAFSLLLVSLKGEARPFDAMNDAWLSPHAGGLVLQANVFGADSRVESSRSGAPFSSIGVVVSIPERASENSSGRGGKLGTGFMVSRCLALTNAHVAVSKNVLFYLGEKTDGGFQMVAKGRVLAKGDRSVHAFGGDWAIIGFQKSQCPGRLREIGYLKLAEWDLSRVRAAELFTAGFPADRAAFTSRRATLFQTGSCRAFNARDAELAWEHDCATSEGQSGSPIMTMVAGRPVVVGMVSGAVSGARFPLRRFDPSLELLHDFANVAVSAPSFIPALRSVMARSASTGLEVDEMDLEMDFEL
jgi:V8-like Glu-specific endopeptidase